jgi:hypothetical protein
LVVFPRSPVQSGVYLTLNLIPLSWPCGPLIFSGMAILTNMYLLLATIIVFRNNNYTCKASKALKKMYDSLPDSNPLKLYIKNNCLHSLSLSGTTGIIAKDKLTATDYDNYHINSNDKAGHP